MVIQILVAQTQSVDSLRNQLLELTDEAIRALRAPADSAGVADPDRGRTFAA